MHAIEGWDNFYVIVGSSAGALIGLQFVVITLIADSPIAHNDNQAGGAFATPSVVHFGIVLLLSALVSIPWSGITMPAVLWGIIGIYGLIYSFVVARRMKKQISYQPVFEDWTFHVLLPLAAYGTLLVSAGCAPFQIRPALFLEAAAVLVLLFVGIHNAWDAVTYHVFVQKREQEKPTKK